MIATLPAASPDFILGLLAGFLLLTSGLAAGYCLGSRHRRHTYRRIRDGLEQQVSSWRAAYKDAIARIHRSTPL